MNRREFLVSGSIAGAALFHPDRTAAGFLAGGGPAKYEANLTLEDKPVAFTVPPLPYAFDALEPYIDAKTMEIHHDKHHGAYVDNLNKAVAGTEWVGRAVEELLVNLGKLPEK